MYLIPWGNNVQKILFIWCFLILSRIDWNETHVWFSRSIFMVTSSYHLLGDHRGKVSKLQSGPNPAHGLLYICQLRTVFCNFKVLKKKKRKKVQEKFYVVYRALSLAIYGIKLPVFMLEHNKMPIILEERSHENSHQRQCKLKTDSSNNNRASESD